jgi:hypothetical protein
VLLTSSPTGRITIASITKLFNTYALPLALPARNIGITPITVKAAPTHLILLKIKNLWIRHAVKNLAQRALLFTPRAYQQFD